MAHTGQKLINYHSLNTSANSVFDATKIEYGELAMRNHAEQPELYIRIGDGATDYAVFLDREETNKMIIAAQQASDGQITALRSDLNDLSAGTKAFSAVVINNYATKDYTNAASSTAYSNATAYTNEVSGYIKSNFGKYATSADTHSAIQALDSKITTEQGRITNLSAGTKAFSAAVVNDYATKEYANTTAATAYSNATGYAKNTVSAEIESNFGKYATSANTHAAIQEAISDTTELTGKLNDLSAGTKAFSAVVVNTYATKEYANTTAATAYSNATAYTNEVSGYIKSNFGKYATSANTHSAIQGLDTKISTEKGRITDLSAATIAFSAGTKAYIDNRLTNVYTYKGSVDTYAQLTAKTGMVKGDVWNVVGAQGTQGQPGYVPAGTNYAWNGTAWDALGGSIDLSNYAETSVTDALDTRITNLNGDLRSFSGYVESTYATQNYVLAASATAYNAATGYAKNTVSAEIESNFGKYATSANTHAAIQEAISDTTELTGKLNDLSAGTKAFSAVVVSTYATKDYANTTAATAYSNATAYTNEVSGYIKSNFGKYATSADTHSAIQALDSKITTEQGRITNLSAGTKAFSAAVVNDYATKEYANTTAATAYSNATGYAKNTVSAQIESNFGKYATSADTHSAIQGLDSKITTEQGRITNLSAATVAIQTTANNALKGFKLTGVTNASSTQSGAKAAFTAGGNAELDLSHLIIDCGDF